MTNISPILNAVAQAVGANSYSNILNWSIGIGSGAAVGIIMFGGLLYTSSSGNSKRKGESIELIRGAVVGLIILILSYVVLNSANPALVSHLGVVSLPKAPQTHAHH